MWSRSLVLGHTPLSTSWEIFQHLVRNPFQFASRWLGTSGAPSRTKRQSCRPDGLSGCCVADQGLGGLLQFHTLLLGELEQQCEGMVTAAVVLRDEDALGLADHCA
jgi:hypothetical protein